MLQGGEILIIALLALVVLGPKRLPELARKLGKWSSELRQAAKDITQGLQDEVEDLQQIKADLKAPIDEVAKSLKEVGEEVSAADPRKHEWTGPKPVSGPTPEDAMRDYEELEELRRQSEASVGGEEE